MINRRIVIVLFLIVFFIPVPSHAFWWMIYHKPAFHGKVIDAETKQPIEGAVVVVEYVKGTVSVPEAYHSTIEVKETLTDKNGEFYIPSYTTIIQPLSVEWRAIFTIYKPGYVDFPGHLVGEKYRLSVPFKHSMPLYAIEEYFSRPLKKVGEIKWDIGKATVTFGVVELLRLKTREERRLTMPRRRGYSVDHYKKQRLFIRLLNEENRNLGFGEYKIEEDK